MSRFRDRGLALGGIALSLVLAAGGVTPVASSQVDRTAQSLDGDAEAIFEFVARQIRYEPYSGVLRGPDGTIASRAGNSADQAWLLASLLGEAGIPHRFAVGSIDDATAEALLESGIVDAASAREAAIDAMAGALPGEEPPEPPPVDADTQAMIDAVAADSDHVKAWADAQLIRTTEMITSSLEDAGIELDAGFTAVPVSERERHLWVQALVGDDWVDLDPSRPQNAAGQALVTPMETPEDLPGDLFHTVELAVVGERLEDDSLITEDLVSVSGMAYEFAGEPIVITNMDEAALPTLSRSFESVLAVATYRPLISIGDSTYVGKPFVFRTADGGGGGGLGGGFFDPGTSAPEATAQWWELRLTSPGEQPVTVRRDVLDRVGREARADGSVDADDLEPLALVDMGGEQGEVPAALQRMSWLAVETGVPAYDAAILQLPLDHPSAMSFIPYQHHVMTELANHDLISGYGLRPFLDAPNVTAMTISARPGAGGQPQVESALDIWHRARGVAQVKGVDSVAAPNLVPGVLAHVTERLLTGDATHGEGDLASISVGAVFDAAQQQGLGLRVLVQPAGSAGLPYSPGVRAIMDQSLSDGWVAIVPERAVSVAGAERDGWWLVDPATGRVADQMADGRGISATTATILKATVLLAGGYFVSCLAYEFVEHRFGKGILILNTGSNANAIANRVRWIQNRAKECVGL